MNSSIIQQGQIEIIEIIIHIHYKNWENFTILNQSLLDYNRLNFSKLIEIVIEHFVAHFTSILSLFFYIKKLSLKIKYKRFPCKCCMSWSIWLEFIQI